MSSIKIPLRSCYVVGEFGLSRIVQQYTSNFFVQTSSGGGIIIFIFGALSFKVLDEMGKLFQGRIFSGPPAPYFSAGKNIQNNKCFDSKNAFDEICTWFFQFCFFLSLKVTW